MKNEAIATAITNSVKGVEIKGLVPEVGMGWGHSVGSDYYGGTIDYVAPDKSWFHCDKGGGFAKFETHKNAFHHGRYVHAYLPNMFSTDSDYYTDIKSLDLSDPKKIFKLLKMEKTCHAIRCTYMNVRHVCEKPQQDHLDPSF